MNNFEAVLERLYNLLQSIHDLAQRTDQHLENIATGDEDKGESSRLKATVELLERYKKVIDSLEGSSPSIERLRIQVAALVESLRSIDTSNITKIDESLTLVNQTIQTLRSLTSAQTRALNRITKSVEKTTQAFRELFATFTGTQEAVYDAVRRMFSVQSLNEFAAALQEIKSQLTSLPDQHHQLVVDTTPLQRAVSDVEKLLNYLQSLENKSITVDVRVNTDTLFSQIRAAVLAAMYEAWRRPPQGPDTAPTPPSEPPTPPTSPTDTTSESPKQEKKRRTRSKSQESPAEPPPVPTPPSESLHQSSPDQPSLERRPLRSIRLRREGKTRVVEAEDLDYMTHVAESVVGSVRTQVFVQAADKIESALRITPQLFTRSSQESFQRLASILYPESEEVLKTVIETVGFRSVLGLQYALKLIKDKGGSVNVRLIRNLQAPIDETTDQLLDQYERVILSLAESITKPDADFEAVARSVLPEADEDRVKNLAETLRSSYPALQAYKRFIYAARSSVYPQPVSSDEESKRRTITEARKQIEQYERTVADIFTEYKKIHKATIDQIYKNIKTAFDTLLDIELLVKELGSVPQEQRIGHPLEQELSAKLSTFKQIVTEQFNLSVDEFFTFFGEYYADYVRFFADEVERVFGNQEVEPSLEELRTLRKKKGSIIFKTVQKSISREARNPISVERVTLSPEFAQESELFSLEDRRAKIRADIQADTVTTDTVKTNTVETDTTTTNQPLPDTDRPESQTDIHPLLNPTAFQQRAQSLFDRLRDISRENPYDPIIVSYTKKLIRSVLDTPKYIEYLKTSIPSSFSQALRSFVDVISDLTKRLSNVFDHVRSMFDKTEVVQNQLKEVAATSKDVAASLTNVRTGIDWFDIHVVQKLKTVFQSIINELQKVADRLKLFSQIITPETFSKIHNIIHDLNRMAEYTGSYKDVVKTLQSLLDPTKEQVDRRKGTVGLTPDYYRYLRKNMDVDPVTQRTAFDLTHSSLDLEGRKTAFLTTLQTLLGEHQAVFVNAKTTKDSTGHAMVVVKSDENDLGFKIYHFDVDSKTLKPKPFEEISDISSLSPEISARDLVTFVPISADEKDLQRFVRRFLDLYKDKSAVHSILDSGYTSASILASAARDTLLKDHQDLLPKDTVLNIVTPDMLEDVFDVVESLREFRSLSDDDLVSRFLTDTSVLKELSERNPEDVDTFLQYVKDTAKDIVELYERMYEALRNEDYRLFRNLKERMELKKNALRNSENILSKLDTTKLDRETYNQALAVLLNLKASGYDEKVIKDVVDIVNDYMYGGIDWFQFRDLLRKAFPARRHTLLYKLREALVQWDSSEIQRASHAYFERNRIQRVRGVAKTPVETFGQSLSYILAVAGLKFGEDENLRTVFIEQSREAASAETVQSLINVLTAVEQALEDSQDKFAQYLRQVSLALIDKIGQGSGSDKPLKESDLWKFLATVNHEVMTTVVRSLSNPILIQNLVTDTTVPEDRVEVGSTERTYLLLGRSGDEASDSLVGVVSAIKYFAHNIEGFLKSLFLVGDYLRHLNLGTLIDAVQYGLDALMYGQNTIAGITEIFGWRTAQQNTDKYRSVFEGRAKQTRFTFLKNLVRAVGQVFGLQTVEEGIPEGKEEEEKRDERLPQSREEAAQKAVARFAKRFAGGLMSPVREAAVEFSKKMLAEGKEVLGTDPRFIAFYTNPDERIMENIEVYAQELNYTYLKMLKEAGLEMTEEEQRRLDYYEKLSNEFTRIFTETERALPEDAGVENREVAEDVNKHIKRIRSRKVRRTRSSRDYTRSPFQSLFAEIVREEPLYEEEEGESTKTPPLLPAKSSLWYKEAVEKIKALSKEGLRLPEEILKEFTEENVKILSKAVDTLDLGTVRKYLRRIIGTKWIPAEIGDKETRKEIVDFFTENIINIVKDRSIQPLLSFRPDTVNRIFAGAPLFDEEGRRLDSATMRSIRALLSEQPAKSIADLKAVERIRDIFTGTEFEESSGRLHIMTTQKFLQMIKDTYGEDSPLYEHIRKMVSMGASGLSYQGPDRMRHSAVFKDVRSPFSIKETVIHELTHSLLDGASENIRQKLRSLRLLPQVERYTDPANEEARALLLQTVKQHSKTVGEWLEYILNTYPQYLADPDEAAAFIMQALVTKNQDLLYALKELYGEDVFNSIVEVLQEAAPSIMNNVDRIFEDLRGVEIEQENLITRIQSFLRSIRQGFSRIVRKSVEDSFNDASDSMMRAFVQELKSALKMTADITPVVSKALRTYVTQSLPQVLMQQKNIRSIVQSAAEGDIKEFVQALNQSAQDIYGWLYPSTESSFDRFIKERVVNIPAVSSMIQDSVFTTLGEQARLFLGFNRSPNDLFEVFNKEFRKKTGEVLDRSSFVVDSVYDFEEGITRLNVSAKTATGSIVNLSAKVDQLGELSFESSGFFDDFKDRVRRAFTEEIIEEPLEEIIYSIIFTVQNVFEQIMQVQDDIRGLASMLQLGGMNVAQSIEMTNKYIMKAVDMASMTGQTFQDSLLAFTKTFASFGVIGDLDRRLDLSLRFAELQGGAQTVFNLTTEQSNQLIQSIFSQLRDTIITSLRETKDLKEQEIQEIATLQAQEELERLFDMFVVASRETGADFNKLFNTFSDLYPVLQGFSTTSELLLALSSVASVRLGESPEETVNALKMFIERLYGTENIEQLARFGIATRALDEQGRLRLRPLSDVMADLYRVSTEGGDQVLRQLSMIIGERARASQVQTIIQSIPDIKRVEYGMIESFTGFEYEQERDRKIASLAGSINTAMANIGGVMYSLFFATGVADSFGQSLKNVTDIVKRFSDVLVQTEGLSETVGNVIGAIGQIVLYNLFGLGKEFTKFVASIAKSMNVRAYVTDISNKLNRDSLIQQTITRVGQVLTSTPIEQPITLADVAARIGFSLEELDKEGDRIEAVVKKIQSAFSVGLDALEEQSIVFKNTVQQVVAYIKQQLESLRTETTISQISDINDQSSAGTKTPNVDGKTVSTKDQYGDTKTRVQQSDISDQTRQEEQASTAAHNHTRAVQDDTAAIQIHSESTRQAAAGQQDLTAAQEEATLAQKEATAVYDKAVKEFGQVKPQIGGSDQSDVTEKNASTLKDHTEAVLTNTKAVQEHQESTQDQVKSAQELVEAQQEVATAQQRAADIIEQAAVQQNSSTLPKDDKDTSTTVQDHTEAVVKDTKAVQEHQEAVQKGTSVQQEVVAAQEKAAQVIEQVADQQKHATDQIVQAEYQAQQAINRSTQAVTENTAAQQKQEAALEKTANQAGYVSKTFERITVMTKDVNRALANFMRGLTEQSYTSVNPFWTSEQGQRFKFGLDVANDIFMNALFEFMLSGFSTKPESLTNIGVGIAGGIAGALLTRSQIGATIGFQMAQAFSESVDLYGMFAGLSEKEREMFKTALPGLSREESELLFKFYEQKLPQLIEQFPNAYLVTEQDLQTSGQFDFGRSLRYGTSAFMDIGALPFYFLTNLYRNRNYVQAMSEALEKTSTLGALQTTQELLTYDPDLLRIISSLGVSSLSDLQQMLSESYDQYRQQREALEQLRRLREELTTRTGMYTPLIDDIRSQIDKLTGAVEPKRPTMSTADLLTYSPFGTLVTEEISPDQFEEIYRRLSAVQSSFEALKIVATEFSLDNLIDSFADLDSEAQSTFGSMIKSLADVVLYVQEYENSLRLITELEQLRQDYQLLPPEDLMYIDQTLQKQYEKVESMKEMYEVYSAYLALLRSEPDRITKVLDVYRAQTEKRREKTRSRREEVKFRLPSMIDVSEYTVADIRNALQQAREKQRRLLQLYPQLREDFAKEQFLLEAGMQFAPVTGVSREFFQEALQQRRSQQPLPEIVDVRDVTNLPQIIDRARQLQQQATAIAPALARQYQQEHLLLLTANNQILSEVGLSQEFLRYAIEENTQSTEDNTDQLRGHYNLPAGYRPPTIWDYYASGGTEAGSVNYVPPPMARSEGLVPLSMVETIVQAAQTTTTTELPDLSALGSLIDPSARPFGYPEPPSLSPDEINTNVLNVDTLNVADMLAESDRRLSELQQQTAYDLYRASERLPYQPPKEEVSPVGRGNLLRAEREIGTLPTQAAVSTSISSQSLSQSLLAGIAQTVAPSYALPFATLPNAASIVSQSFEALGKQIKQINLQKMLEQAFLTGAITIVVNQTSQAMTQSSVPRVSVSTTPALKASSPKPYTKPQ